MAMNDRGTEGVVIVAVLADCGMEGSVQLVQHQKTMFFFFILGLCIEKCSSMLAVQ
jgi:hypothetical protein